MRIKNGSLVAVVVSIALLAVIGGVVLALRQGPQDADGATAPLTGPTSGSPSVSASASPSAFPSGPATSPATPPAPPAPSKTPATPPARSGPVKVELADSLAKLPRGRDPQVSYLSGRQVLGGAGGPVTIPGTGAIRRIARLNQVVLAVQSRGDGSSELLRVRGTPATVQRVPDVSTLAVSEDATSAAYATDRRTAGGDKIKGSTVYAEEAYGSPRKLSRPNDWNVEVLGHAGGKVYFRSQQTKDGTDWNLYAWTPGESAATRVSTVSSPTAVSPDGSLAASLKNSFDYGSCSTATELTTGKSRWRTCDYQVTGFSPTGAMAIGSPAYGDGYGPLEMAALDGRTGNVLREWRGIVFHDAYAEDDDHLLMRADTGPDSKAAIIRCAVSTGRCERATALTSATLRIGN